VAELITKQFYCMTLTIERTFAALVALVLLAAAIPAFAAAPNWELNDNTAIVFTCGGGEYPHTLLNVSQDVNGELHMGSHRIN
jgi:hypothetical protein